MAIDLPPAMPPTPVSMQFVTEKQTAEPLVARVGEYTLRVGGDHYLQSAQIDSILASAKSPSQALQLLTAATAREGRLLVRYLYHVSGRTIHVHALQMELAAVRGDEAIDGYFDGLEGDSDLTRAEYERARLMAEVRSQRSGVDYQVSYRFDAARPDAVALYFDAVPKQDFDANRYTVQIGNHGSQFVGRYLTSLTGTHDLSSGTRLQWSVQGSISEWGESGAGDDYQHGGFRIDHPFAWGLVGIEGSYVRYEHDSFDTVTTTSGGLPLPFPVPGATPTTTVQQVPFEAHADVARVALFGEHVLSSGSGHRFNIYERLEWVDSEVVRDDNGEVMLDEEYATLELGTKWFGATQTDAGNQWLFNVTLGVRGGVTTDRGTLGTGDSQQTIINEFGDQTLPVGERSAEFVSVLPKLGLQYRNRNQWRWRAELTSQISDHRVPQHQQWVLGGYNSMSAYLPGALVGDSGHYFITDIEREWQWAGGPFKASLFLEYGMAEYEEGVSGAATGSAGDDRQLGDVGIRLDTQLNERLSFSVIAAESVLDDNLSDEYLEAIETELLLVVKAEL